MSLSLKAYPETAETLSASIAGKKELPIYCVEKDKPQISLSFDAAWGNQDTRKILEVLKKNNVKVTFFMTGGWIEKYPEDVKAIAKDGHDLGNHSENHKQMSRLTANECMEEIMKPHQKVKALTGKDMILFRPPYGDYNNTFNTEKDAIITASSGMWILWTGKTMMRPPLSAKSQNISTWEMVQSSCATTGPNIQPKHWMK